MRRPAIQVAATALLVGAVGLLAGLWLARPDTDRETPVRRFAIAPVDLQEDAVISPDGKQIAYVAGVPPDTKLWVQDLGQEEPREIEGTERASHPFWSPDSELIGFAVGSDLKKVSTRGGSSTTLCELPGETIRNGSWSPDGSSIVFRSGVYGRLHEVPAQGGRARLLIEPSQPDRDVGYVYPRFLPAEAPTRALVFEAWDRGPLTGEIVVQNLETGERRVLAQGVGPAYSPSGHILYRPSEFLRALHALPFSLQTLKPTGEPFPVGENAAGSVGVSRDGTLVYVDRGPNRQWQLVLRDRAGKKLGLVGQPHDEIGWPCLSPDERRVAAQGRQGDVEDAWIHEIARPVAARLTFGEYYRVQWLAWSPEGDRVAFSARGEGIDIWDIFVKAIAGGGEAKTLVTSPDTLVMGDWSPDGRYIVYRSRDATTRNSDLWYLELTDNGSEPVPFLQTPFTESLPQFSPDGRFVAYLSDESGRREVHVQRFPEGGVKVQVSTGGARQMRWGRNGEIFYLELGWTSSENAPDESTLVAVPVTTAPELSVGRPSRLFSSAGWGPLISPMYDVFVDGQRFVMLEPVGEPPPATIRVVENWFEEFRDRQAGSE